MSAKFARLKQALANLEEAQSHYKGELAQCFRVGDSVSWRHHGHLQIGKITGLPGYTPQFGTRIPVQNVNTGVRYSIQLYQVFEAEN
jgi:hypothetical protein